MSALRTLRKSVIAGAGAVALAGAMIVPGIASAADLDSDSVTLTDGSGGELATYSATDNGDCTAFFELKNGEAAHKGVSWRVDYRVDGEPANIGEADAEDLTKGVFRPVLTNNPDIIDIVTYDIAVDAVKVDLEAPRTVPTGDGGPHKVLEGVAPNEDGTHTVSFKMYSGSPTSAYVGVADSVGEITVTGCPTDDGSDEGNGSLGSLDLFGSLEGLLPA